MAIQVRRGNESDFDASKMLPGEWAVSLDTRYVRMCFAPGIVLRMSTYDAFEADMAQIQAILAECRSIQSAVQRIQTEVNSKASLTVEYANDAKESADRAYSEAERAKTYADNAEAVTNVQIATKDRAGLIKGGDNYIAEDGTLMIITETTETTMPNSYEGRLLIKEIGGVMEQGENPSPTNQQEIRNSVISGIKTYGKNFVYSDRASDLVTQGITFHIVRDSLGRILYIEANGTATADAVFNLSKKQLTVGKEYVISGCPSGGSTATYSLNWAYAGDDVGEGFSDVYKGTEGQLRIRIKNGITVNNLRFYPMLREIGTDATYEPYTESTITFSQPIELYGLEDVQDILTSKQIGRKYAKRVFNGSEAWTASSNVAGRFYVDRMVEVRLGLLLCTQAKGVTYQSTELNECFSSPNATGRFTINTSFATVDEWKAHLASNPMTVVYELAEEVIEDLPLADQIGLNSLATYDGITYVEFIYEGLEPTFKGKYGTSEVGGMTLESLLTARNNDLRLTAVENAVVNNI